MNEAERLAFDGWCQIPMGHALCDMQRNAWQAALEWQRSQCEPYLWMTEWWVEGGPDNGEYEYETNHSNEFSCGRKNGFPLYRHPPTAQINEQMREALQDLIDVQNGPPLMKWKQEWEDAMAKAGAALIAAKSGVL